MTELVGSLIIEAYYLSGVVSPTFQSVSGDQVKRGLIYLNDLLSIQSLTPSLIPFFREYNFNFVIGQEKYFVQNLIYAETFTYVNGSVRYMVQDLQRKKYWGNSRVESASGYPYDWYQERCAGGSYIYVYWLPSNTFPAKIYGKFGATDVTLNTDLSLTYDKSYITYLKYSLAATICDYNHINVLPRVSEKIDELECCLRNVSSHDFSLKHYSIVPAKDYYNFTDADLGKGWDASATVGM